jgi:3-oxoacyl-(acyl-carrier-protein) synthase
VAETLASLAAGTRRPTLPDGTGSPLCCPVFAVSGLLTTEVGSVPESRTLALALAAVEQALADAASPHRLRGLRLGVCFGTTVASQLNDLAFYTEFRRNHRPQLGAVRRFVKSNLAEAIAGRLSASGPRATVVNACSSGADAIAVAGSWLKAGLCDIAVAGGADELSRVPLAGFQALGVVSDQPCAPFDRDRKGLNLGEGAGAVVLETGDSAARRGHFSPLLLAGCGMACDAHHLTAPHPEGRGLVTAIRTALAEADVSPARIAFVNAHGTATVDNDRVEGRVLAAVFGTGVKVLSTKGFTGHTLGAAGALEIVFTALGLREQWVPASVGFVNQAADIPLAPLQDRTDVHGDCALSTSLAFGGNNTAVIVRRAA